MLALARRVLAVPLAYRAFSALVGGAAGRDVFVRDHVRARPGDRVLDVGCGPADIVGHLPDVDYTGFDMSAEYIATAKKSWGRRRARFYQKRVSEESLAEHSGFDVVLAIGLLHHLDDLEAAHLLELARAALVPGGRLVTLDGVFTRSQSAAARYLISRDRGRYVRDERGYLALAERVFPRVIPTVRSDLMRIPYTHLILECEKT